MKKNIIKILFFIVIMALGVFMFIYGGFDDSPGAQGLGVLAVVVGIIGLIKSRKKISLSKFL